MPTFFLDISEALATAKECQINAVNVTFINQNILETEDLGQQF
jgi:release factor glutamine methyltransferase